jgi:NADPH:quinone reductase-like Zn-dependent oxidoreductase
VQFRKDSEPLVEAMIIEICPPEIKLYRLSEAAAAHRLSESRHFRGKLVFQVR